jgi:hypothetical protein
MEKWKSSATLQSSPFPWGNSHIKEWLTAVNATFTAQGSMVIAQSDMSWPGEVDKCFPETVTLDRDERIRSRENNFCRHSEL